SCARWPCRGTPAAGPGRACTRPARPSCASWGAAPAPRASARTCGAPRRRPPRRVGLGVADRPRQVVAPAGRLEVERERDVDVEPLAQLALGWVHPVVAEEREALDEDAVAGGPWGRDPGGGGHVVTAGEDMRIALSSAQLPRPYALVRRTTRKAVAHVS